MTDFTQLSDKELSEAINFHRRQRNLSRGMNEALHMRQAQTVRLLEAEEARRLEEANAIGPKGSIHRAASADQSDKEYIMQRQFKDKWKKENPGKQWPGYEKAGFKSKYDFKEEVELDEQTMPGNVALRLVDRHQAAAFHHKKNGNMKGYAAHWKVADAIEDAVIRAGRDMPIRSKRHEAASDKALREYPHRVAQKEEVELDEVSSSTLRSYVDKAKDDKARQKKAATVAKNDAKKYGMSSDMDRADAAKRKASNRNTGMSVAKKKLGMYPKDRAQPNVMAREEVEINEASYRDSGYRNMLKASQRADKEADKLRDQQAKADKKKALKSEEVELDEASDLRITKVYNKFPKKATYAVHSADRSYHKEFDSMEAAQAHKAEKSK